MLGIRQLSQSNSMQQLGARFFGLFPIKAKEKFIGVISCIGIEPRKLIAEEIRLINSMCDQIGVAVDNINLFEEVRNKTDRAGIVQLGTPRSVGAADRDE